jgi:hypothetical protein
MLIDNVFSISKTEYQLARRNTMKKTALFALLCAGISVTLAQQSETLSVRLVYSDAKTNSLNVINFADRKKIASFSTPGKITYAITSGSQQHILVAHRDDNRLTVLNSGLSTTDHGDHKDLIEKAPYITATMNIGKQPTHYFVHDKTIAFFNDGDGTVAILDEDKLGLSMDFEQIKTAQPDHGGVIVLEKQVLVGYLRLGRIDVFERKTGKLQQALESCPVLHGEAMHGTGFYWGCGDGVMLLKPDGDKFSATKIANPVGTPLNTRVGVFAESKKHNFVVGNFGKGLAFADPTKTVLELMALPANPIKMEFLENGNLILLTADGNLHSLDVTKRSVIASVNVTPEVKASGEGVVRPSFAIMQDRVFVTNPEQGSIVEVNTNKMQIVRRMAVGGIPASIAISMAQGVKH